MLWYFLFLLALVFCLFIGKGYFRKNTTLFFYIILPSFICFGYMIGSDWRMYETEFYDVSQRLETKEPSYYLLAQSFKAIGFGFWEFSILYKLIGYYVFLNIYRRYSCNNIWGLVYWFPNYALFLWMDHPARNFIAIIIFSCALVYVEKGEFKKFLILYLLASSFHATCLVMLSVYFVVRMTPNKKYNIWLIVIVVMFFVAEFLKIYLAPLLEVLNMEERMKSYMLEEDTTAKMSITRFGIFFVLLMLASIYIDVLRKKVRYADFILKLSFMYVVFFCIGNIHNIFFRFQYFLMIPICVLVSYLCLYLPRFIIRQGLRAFIIVLAFVYMQNLITRDSQYIPYSNYLQYTFEEKPSYNYRYQYNLKNSPYKK